jgi:DNA-directed RNA polymerase specialized sigma24 family protein
MAMGTSKSDSSESNQETALLDWQRLRKEGRSYREIGEIIGRSPNTVKAWLRRYGVEKPPPIPPKPMDLPLRSDLPLEDAEAVFLLYEQGYSYYQISDIVGRPRNTVRYWVLNYYGQGKLPPEPMETPLRSELPPEDIEAVLLLHRKGYGYKRISAIVERPRNTVQGWILHYYQPGKAPPLPPRPSELPARADLPQDDAAAVLLLRQQNFTYAQIGLIFGRSKSTVKNWHHKLVTPYPLKKRIDNAEDWRRHLRRGAVTATNQNPRYILVCAAQKSRNLENLLAVICYRLKQNPFHGDVFIFCDLTHKTLVTVQWDGNALRIVKRRLQRGRYPWPPKKLGLFMEIKKEEYELLMLYSPKKIMSATP